MYIYFFILLYLFWNIHYSLIFTIYSNISPGAQVRVDYDRDIIRLLKI
jgi:E3 ubiquitin-protein ligase DOA10